MTFYYVDLFSTQWHNLRTMTIHPYEITPLTLLDYPYKVACIFWYAGCNLRCPYCYNPDVVLGKPGSLDEMGFLMQRHKYLDGVVLSGGECTLNPEIEELCRAIKSLNLLVKIDTNGSKPEVIKNLIDKKLIDYVALDNKNPEYKSDLLWPDKTKLYDKFKETVAILNDTKFHYEIRTTVHPDLLNEEDIIHMINDSKSLGYSGTYYLQVYFHAAKTLGNMNKPSTSTDFDKIKSGAELDFEVRQA